MNIFFYIQKNKLDLKHKYTKLSQLNQEERITKKSLNFKTSILNTYDGIKTMIVGKNGRVLEIDFA